MSTTRPPTPRHIGPYSPRHPSPLGFPPLAPHVAFQQPSYAWPHTPDRLVQPKGPSNMRVAFPPEARRPLAGSTQRPKSQPPPPLKLENHHVPPPHKTGNALTLTVPGQEVDAPPPSPTPSEASSLSLYSAENVTKNFPIETVQKHEEEKTKNPFCSCFGFLSRKSREKEAKILGPPVPKNVQPASVPQMTQTGRMTQSGRRRPSPLNL